MKIFYWAPWIGNIGTIKAVLNSAYILERYSKKKIKTKIINSVGEWDSHKSHGKFIDLQKFKFYRFLPQGGYLKSRITYIIIFIFSLLPLKKLIKNEKPDYLVIQLITSLPLFLKIFFNLNTKIILRISGYPKMNFLRKIFWKVVSKKIDKITFPSRDLYLQFKKLNIFDEIKMNILYDPIISYRDIVKFKNDKNIPQKIINKKFILCIGRLTKQKNFSFIVKNFGILKNKYKNLKLVIIGEGELKKELQQQIKDLDLGEDIFLMGFQSNVYKFFKYAEVFILSSLWEEIGFVIVEAASCNLNIISSDCKNGPKEFLSDGKGGYLFENNNSEDFLKKFDEFMFDSKNTKYNKKISAKNNTRYFSFLNHFKSFRDILSND